MHLSTPVSGRITDRGLFVDARGDLSGTPLLYVHGGPGQGAYQFMAIQGDRLGAAAGLVGFDQRGVGRSAPLADAPNLTIADLVDDCEAIREALGVSRWVVLGQSFGGMLALRYAASYPGSVRAVIFENPSWDLALTIRAALPRVASKLDAAGDATAARAARVAADSDDPARELWAAYLAALGALGDAREEYFTPRPETRQLLRDIWSARSRDASEGDEASMSTMRHSKAIQADDTLYESQLPLLAKLEMPAMLITGGLDPTTSPEQREAFRAAGHTLVEFTSAGHFVQADEPEDYARTVIKFAGGQDAG
jgi:proline iminopeptidase